MTLEDIFRLVDGLRDRGVPEVRLKDGEFELVVTGIPPLKADAVPTDPVMRQRMLDDPNVPDRLKEKIEHAEDEDLYASS